MGYKETVESMGDAGEVASDVAATLKKALVDKIKVRLETTLFDEETEPFKESTKTEGNNIALSILKPKLTVLDPTGAVLYSAAPYGDPKKAAGGVKAGIVAGVLGAFAAIFGLGRLSKK